MEPTYWIIIVVGVLVVGGVLLCLLRGIVKAVLFGLSLVGAGVTYYMLQKYGFNYLAFVFDSPAAWMVTAMAVLGAIIVFAAFQYGLSWFNRIFSWEGKFPGAGGVMGVLMTVFMALFISWFIAIGIFYFGSLSELRRYKDLATNVAVRQEIPYLTKMKQNLEASPAGKYLVMIDPLSDPERLKVAKVVAYMASEENSDILDACEARLGQYLPGSKKINRLAHDKGIRVAMKKNDMGILLNDSKLTRIVSENGMREALKGFDPDKLFGMKKAEDEKEKGFLGL